MHNIQKGQRFICQVEYGKIVAGSCVNLKPEVKINFKIIEGRNAFKVRKQFDLHADDPVYFEIDKYNKQDTV